MKNDEIRQANRKALPKLLLVLAVSIIVGGVIGYYSGHSAAIGVLQGGNALLQSRKQTLVISFTGGTLS